ncbi:hypothetical protein [Agrobacterium bohemicum]|uniref:Uncharacterized protein n=1 Tax=Agrobacterium bohemicum TaxID=2052828 RepID=A0A135P1L1_9HYPH|nr:hypothetical protein [Agrobacterium bohemicum]KXG85321.1 hypothetical protein ATO67_08985 [Agrobacterium bohemicum]
MNQKTLVEVSVPDTDGTMIPFGIMNSEQAAELPDDYEVLIAHPAGDQNELPTGPQADVAV